MPTRRFYVNSAPQQTLASGITNVATSCTIQSSFAGWPTNFPFFAVLEKGTASQEIVLVTNIVGLVATIARGQDGSAAVTHNAGATLDQMFVRQDADEANAHTSANAGVHGISGNVVGDTDVQTLSNKTLSAPTLSGTATGSGTLGGSIAVNTAGNVTAANVNGGSLAAPIHRVYTSSTTWTKPAGLRAVRVRVAASGAGGGSATGAGTGRAAAGGGGAGAYAESVIPAVSLGATVAVTVGTGGAGGTAGGAGSNGGTSSFGSLVVAGGGTGGGGGANTTTATSSAGGAGGTASAGDIQIPGGNGGVGLAISTGPAVLGGDGGGNPLAGPQPGASSAGLAFAGNNYGGGGSGATASTANTNGGAGAGGVVIVEEIY